MLSGPAIEKSGIFNPEHVAQLLIKMKSDKQVSEIDNMAITAILSIQILNDLFVNRSLPELTDQELINFDKTIFEFTEETQAIK
jgi:asparagine synthase (glutamine-hydrolysing)